MPLGRWGEPHPPERFGRRGRCGESGLAIGPHLAHLCAVGGVVARGLDRGGDEFHRVIPG